MSALVSIPSFFNAPCGDLQDLSPHSIAVAGLFCDHYGAGEPGARFAPRQLRYANWPDRGVCPELPDRAVVDVGDLNVFPLEYERNDAVITEQAAKIARKKARLLTVGGDYSVIPPVVSGLLSARSGRDIGFIRLSRRLDIQAADAVPPQMPVRSTSTSRIATMLDGKEAAVALLGASTGITAEEYAQASPYRVHSCALLHRDFRRGLEQIREWAAGFTAVYVSLDADVLCEHQLETALPKSSFGLSVNMVLDLLAALRSVQVIGADFTGYRPDFALPGRQQTAFAAQMLCALAQLLNGSEACHAD